MFVGSGAGERDSVQGTQQKKSCKDEGCEETLFGVTLACASWRGDYHIMHRMLCVVVCLLAFIGTVSSLVRCNKTLTRCPFHYSR